MKKICLVVAITAIALAVQAGESNHSYHSYDGPLPIETKVTTATLTKEYNDLQEQVKSLQQQVIEGQAQLLRLEGAISVMQYMDKKAMSQDPYTSAGLVH